MKINENKLAAMIAVEETGDVEVNIAQIKEILKVTLDILAQEFERSEVVALLEAHD